MLDLKIKDQFSSSLIESQVDRHIMLFDLAVDGHHSDYIRHLVNFWLHKGLVGKLSIVVSPDFFQLHSQIVKSSLHCSCGSINFIGITSEEKKALKSKGTLRLPFIRDFQEWKLFSKYAKTLKVTNSLFMYFDPFQIVLATGANFPCRFSGIYFRPAFHYHKFSNHKPSFKEYFVGLKEKILFHSALNHPQLKTLFTLDPYIINYYSINNHVKLVCLPDPVVIENVSYSSTAEEKKTAGISPHKQTYLLFGNLDRRKGIFQLLDAISILSPEECKKMCFMFVGKMANDIEVLVDSRITEIRKKLPIQITLHNEFISEKEIQHYFSLADVILAPYQKHVGMSGILLRAAAAGKPVLCSDYGLMGEVTRQHKLGLTVDSEFPGEIAKGLKTFLTHPSDTLCDIEQMMTYAESNSHENFARTIFSYV